MVVAARVAQGVERITCPFPQWMSSRRCRACPSCPRMKRTGAAQPHPAPGWLQPHRALARRDPSRGTCLTGRPKPNLAQAPGSLQHRSMANSPSAAFLRLRATISGSVEADRWPGAQLPSFASAHRSPSACAWWATPLDVGTPGCPMPPAPLRHRRAACGQTARGVRKKSDPHAVPHNRNSTS
jgi:hypothetical protein